MSDKKIPRFPYCVLNVSPFSRSRSKIVVGLGIFSLNFFERNAEFFFKMTVTKLIGQTE